ncbi:ATP-binding cassette sub-family A member 3 [Lamellibrachia satsuma]|nr:ATP-binding cassette sub-family A member 3 [Lamellibrachia satsuma]
MCTRLGIMVDGRFRCLGSTQHLKHRFGEKYCLRILIYPFEVTGKEGLLTKVKEFVESTFQHCVLKDERERHVTYSIPPESADWAHLFQSMEVAMVEYSIEDYQINKTSLKQMFADIIECHGIRD